MALPTALTGRELFEPQALSNEVVTFMRADIFRPAESAEENEARSKEEAEAEKSAALEEAANFEGCYSALLSTNLQLLPDKASYRAVLVIQGRARSPQ